MWCFAKKSLHDTCRMDRRIVMMKLICSLGHCKCDGHTVHKLSQRHLTADWLAPRESEFHGCTVRSPLTGCRVTLRPHDQLPRYSKWLDIFRTALIQCHSMQLSSYDFPFFSHTYRASWYYQILYSPTDAKWNVLKTVLKFTLKQLRHVSFQSHHHQGAHYSCLLKLQLLK